jgi:hypothetical protein
MLAVYILLSLVMFSGFGNSALGFLPQDIRDIVSFVIFGIIFSFFYLAYNIWSMLAYYLVAHSFFQNKKIHLLRIIYRDSLQQFFPFFLFAVRVWWYILWPFTVCLVAVPILLMQFNEEIWSTFVLLFVLIFAYGLTIQRMIAAFFTLPFFLEKNLHTTRKEIFHEALVYSKGMRWRIFFSVVGLFLIGLTLYILIIVPLIISELFASDFAYYVGLLSTPVFGIMIIAFYITALAFPLAIYRNLKKENVLQ